MACLGSPFGKSVKPRLRCYSTLGAAYLIYLGIKLWRHGFFANLGKDEYRIEKALLPQFSLLVATFMSLSFLCLFAYAYLADQLRDRLALSEIPGRVSKVFGTVFIASGIALANASNK